MPRPRPEATDARHIELATKILVYGHLYMAPAQIAEARRIAREWKPKTAVLSCGSAKDIAHRRRFPFAASRRGNASPAESGGYLAQRLRLAPILSERQNTSRVGAYQAF
jgi:hypothetical protein